MSFAKHFPVTGATKTVLVLDIGSGSVGGAFVSVSNDEPPIILYSTRIPIVFQRTLKHDRLLFEMLRSLRKCVETLQRHHSTHKAGRKIGHVYVTLAAPWHISQTHLIKMQREQSFMVTERFLRDVLHEARENFDTAAVAEATFGGHPVRLEEAIMQTTLNGYPTSKPYGKRVRKLEAAVYLSLVDSAVQSGILEEIERIFGERVVTLHPFLLAAFSVVREVHAALNDFLLIDIGGEAAEIGLVRNGILLESMSLPWGRNYILRELADELGTIPEEAHTMLRLSESAGTKSNPNIERAQRMVTQKWLKAFGAICAELAEDERLPEDVLLTTLPDLAPWFATVLKSDIGSHYTYTQKPFSVTLLGGSDSVQHLRFADGAEHDPFLTLETAAFTSIGTSL